MAEHQYRQVTHQQHGQQQHPTDIIKGMLPEHGPSKTQVAAVATLLPVGGTLLLLSGITLAGTLVGLAVTLPLFVIFSPVLIPAALVIGLAITGFLTSGAFGITALSSLSWMANFLRRMRVPEQMEHAKRSAQETAGYMGQKVKETGQKVKETGQTIQSKTHEAGKEGERKLST